MFAPFALLIGLGFWFIGSWKWKAITGPAPRLKGKARRNADRAAKATFPIDRYKKW